MPSVFMAYVVIPPSDPFTSIINFAQFQEMHENSRFVSLAISLSVFHLFLSSFLFDFLPFPSLPQVYHRREQGGHPSGGRGSEGG